MARGASGLERQTCTKLPHIKISLWHLDDVLCIVWQCMRFMLPSLSTAAFQRLACQNVLTAITCAPGPVDELLQICIGEQHKEAEATGMLLCNACQDVVPYSLACLQCADMQFRGEEDREDRTDSAMMTISAARGHDLLTCIRVTCRCTPES